MWPFAKLLWTLVVEQALHRCRKCWRKNERKKRRWKRNKSVHHLSIMCSKFYNVTLMHSALVSVLPALQLHHAAISCTPTHLTALFQGLPRWASTRKVKPIWILLEQQTVSGSGISWAICKSAPRSRQITTPAPYHSFFTGRMPFMQPNQQRQSTEGTAHLL